MGYLLKRKFFGAVPLRYFAAQDALILAYDEFWVHAYSFNLSHSGFFALHSLYFLAFSSAARRWAIITPGFGISSVALMP